MKHEYDYHARWTNGISKHHEIDLDIGLFLEDFLKHRNIRDELLHNEAGLRKELMSLIVSKLVPQIIDETGLSSHTPGTVNTHAKTSLENDQTVGVPKKAGLSHYIRSRIKMTMKIDSDRPVNAMQAFHANRGGMASDIADNIINLLKKEYLGVDVHEHATEWSIIGNEVTDVRHRVKRSTTRN